MDVYIIIGILGIACWVYVLIKATARMIAREVKKEIGKN
jgi:hypothetical protein